MSKGYGRKWLSVWSVVACPAVLTAFVMWSWPGVIGLLVVALMFSAAICGSTPNATDPRTIYGGHTAREVMGPAIRWAVIVVAVVVTAVLSGWLALLAVTALLGTSPWAVGRLRRRTPQDADEVGDTVDRIRVLVRQLDVAGLCSAWRTSHDLLMRVTNVRDRSRVVMLRQLYLDEMERRDAAGFQRWLEVARAAEDPEAFLSERPGEDGAAAA